MTWFEIGGVSLLSSLLTSGLVLTLLRKMLFGYLDHRLKALERASDFSREQWEKRAENRLLAYPELMQFCYHAKLVAEECLEHDGAPMPSRKVEDFAEIVSQITDRLVRYRLMIPRKVFKDLHRTKHVCQDLIIYLDTLSRTGRSKGDVKFEYAQQLAKEAATTLGNRVDKLDRILRSSMRDIIGAK